MERFIDLLIWWLIDWHIGWLTDWLVHENPYPLYIDRVFSLATAGDWWLHWPVLKEGLHHPVESWLQGADVRHQRRGYHRNQGRHKLQLASRLKSWLECSYTFYMNFLLTLLRLTLLFRDSNWLIISIIKWILHKLNGLIIIFVVNINYKILSLWLHVVWRLWILQKKYIIC